MAKSRLWSVVHPQSEPSAAAASEPEDERVAEQAPAVPVERTAAIPAERTAEAPTSTRSVRLGQRGAPVAAPRRTRR